MLGRLSYRYKVPLSLCLAILLTGFVGAIILSWRSLDDLREDLFRNAMEITSALSGTLIASINHDDVWRAYEALRALSAVNEESPQRVLIVLDNNDRVFVSNLPQRFPILSEIHKDSPELARVEQKIARSIELKPLTYDDTENRFVYFLIPLLDEQVRFGTLIVAYHRSLFLPRFMDIVWRVAITALIAMAILLPIAWFWGKRMVKPLTELARYMGQVGKAAELPKPLVPAKPKNDEIAQLWNSFGAMVQQLDEQERLKSKMVVSERLAAIGRLAAGVAHEINNPLGGMLNAISTFRRHGTADPVTQKTISLIERGLDQIKDTVSALLVEARSQTHHLAPQDVEDVLILVQPDAHKKSVEMNWCNELAGSVALPSTPVRQIMLNLSLNAVQASPAGGAVDFCVEAKSAHLYIAVSNKGATIPKDQLDKIFEPFHHSETAESGLGLWVSYQIVRQLNGEISVISEQQRTVIEVNLPLEQAA